jgi:hypothetical protein
MSEGSEDTVCHPYGGLASSVGREGIDVEFEEQANVQIRKSPVHQDSASSDLSEPPVSRRWKGVKPYQPPTQSELEPVAASRLKEMGKDTPSRKPCTLPYSTIDFRRRSPRPSSGRRVYPSTGDRRNFCCSNRRSTAGRSLMP